jgi:ArsR family transcriptional regulator, lead/cadmium/zinc/bismuth-responsive transcriptional repressor
LYPFDLLPKRNCYANLRNLDDLQNILYNITIEYLFNCYIMTNSSLPILDEHTAAHVAELFRAFSDTSRVRILSALAEREYNVTELAAVVGITESGVSHHLRGLRQMRLVQTRRDGKEVYYRVDDEHIIALFQQGVNHIKNG